MDTILEDSITCLKQGVRLLKSMTGEVYTFKSPDTLNSTVGGHFRHNIDHYKSFLGGLPSAEIDYDDRERDFGLETDPAEALREMELLLGKLENLDGIDLEMPVRIKLDCGSEPSEPWSRSTGRRELQFLLSHTVHHYALIAMICRMRGFDPEEAFGVAPSTLKHRQQAATVPACAH